TEMVAAAEGDGSQAEVDVADKAANKPDNPVENLLPSDTSLPGGEPPTVVADGGSGAADNQDLAVSKGPTKPTGPVQINPSMLSKRPVGENGSELGLGWESTNLKVQHILSADPGNGELEKIVLNVPVLYETRTMRWTTEDIAQARNIMSRLMVYERNLNTLRKEGQAIFKDWNALLENTVPAPALRADSPSLPYNHGQGGQSGILPGSSSVIKVTP
ncbi:MAG: hypothetical protein KJO79_04700, partial [Verrucomicrobiae bacterium]|nr:hypothetical protein [Verrucomicrobiae bacterium]NNJ86456.1 hypothetical protein [Akkermansiaceae bacterium]